MCLGTCEKITICPNPEKAIAGALAFASPTDLICVTGSLYPCWSGTLKYLNRIFQRKIALEFLFLSEKSQARNEMEGGSTERNFNAQTRFIEPQGKLKDWNSSFLAKDRKPVMEWKGFCLGVSSAP